MLQLSLMGALPEPVTVPVPLAPSITPGPSPTAEAAALAAVIDAQNKRIFKLTMISTAVVATSALITAWRTLRQLRRDEAILAAKLARR
jgi:hypothetical protein